MVRARGGRASLDRFLREADFDAHERVCLRGTALGAPALTAELTSTKCIGYQVEVDEWLPVDEVDGQWTTRLRVGRLAELALEVDGHHVVVLETDTFVLDTSVIAATVECQAAEMPEVARRLAERALPALAAFPRLQLRLRERCVMQNDAVEVTGRLHWKAIRARRRRLQGAPDDSFVGWARWWSVLADVGLTTPGWSSRAAREVLRSSPLIGALTSRHEHAAALRHLAAQQKPMEQMR